MSPSTAEPNKRFEATRGNPLAPQAIRWAREEKQMTVRDFLSTFAIPIGVGLGLLWAWVRHRGRMYRVTPTDVNDPRWTEAIARARSTLPEMRALHEEWASEMYVKYPLNTTAGTIEHVWGRLLSLSAEEMRVTLETPPIHSPVGTAPYVVPLSDLEDWQLVLPDNKIRGGFTTRAQIEIAKTTGASVPSHISELEDRFVDA